MIRYHDILTALRGDHADDFRSQLWSRKLRRKISICALKDGNGCFLISSDGCRLTVKE